MRDRFGKLPAAAELLLRLASVKLLAGDIGVTGMETRGDKIMLTRGNDFVQINDKFPRLTGQTATAKLKDIRQVLAGLKRGISDAKPAI